MTRPECSTEDCDVTARHQWLFPSGVREWCQECYTDLPTEYLPGRYVGRLLDPEREGVLDKDVMDRAPEAGQYEGGEP